MENIPKRACNRTLPFSETWRKRSACLAVILALGLQSNVCAASETLDGATLMKLALQGTWAAEDAEIGYWSWNVDKSVCMRLGESQGKCADTGTWTINGNVICYELTWWGEYNNDRKSCFTVQMHGNGRYETLYHGGAMVSTFFHFSVLE